MKGATMSCNASKDDIPKTVCRHQQDKLLSSLITSDGATVPCIFIYGHTASGKSVCLRNVFDRKEAKYVKVHCAELYSVRLIYEHIITEISGSRSDRCDDLNTFIRLLHNAVKDHLEGQTLYLVFEKADRLRSLPANLLPALLRLQELAKSSVCVILESEIIWENFRQFTTGCREPVAVHFPPYTKDDLVEILSRDMPDDCDTDFYTNYCTLIVSMFHSLTRNLRELKYLTAMNFNKYREPVLNSSVAEDNQRALYKAIEPHLKLAMSSIYLHEVSSNQWERAQTEEEGVVKLTESHMRQSIELPYFSKYLLIASYLASYNPAKSDKKFFVKNAGRMRKTQRMMKRSDRTSSQVLGPKQFQLDRLMAIFYSIIDGKVMPTTDLYTQICNLVTLRLLGSVGSEAQFDSPKYKCLVSLEFIQSISRTVQFDVLHYLYDFN